jgi:putative membrane protein
MMGWGHGWGAGGWVTMALTMVVSWGLLAALIVWIVRGASSSTRGAGPANPGPDSVLSDRFSRGEIDEEEFLRRRAVLHGFHGHNGPPRTG